MFSDAYRGVTHFGHWAEETADQFGRRDALEVLRQAAERAANEDQRTDHVHAAIDYLSRFATRPAILERFRSALEVTDPVHRAHQVREAYRDILRHLDGP